MSNVNTKGTVLQSLAQRQDGLMLLESFESANFISDQAWVLLNGTVTRDNSVAKDALYSLKMDSTCPLIQNQPGGYTKYAVSWFYDEATFTTQLCNPAMVLSDSVSGATVGIGVNNAKDSAHYCIELAPGVWVPTAIARSTGWHRFSMSPDANGNPHLFVDNLDTSFGLGAATFFDTIKLGCQANTGDGFGWFDLVALCSSSTLTVYNLTDPQGLVLVCAGMVPQANSAAGVAVLDMSQTDVPLDGYLVVTNPLGNGAPVYQSDIQNFSAGDIYFLNQFRFGRRPTSLSIQPTQSRTDTMAVDGPRQSVFFYDADKVSLSFNDITEDLANQLRSWFTTAKRGETFSVCVEESDFYVDFTQQIVTAFPTGQLVVAYAPPGKGKWLVVQSLDGTIKETVQIASSSYSVATGLWTITLVNPQSEAVQAGMQVRALRCWPFCMVTEKMLNIVLSNAKVKRWTVQINFMELIQNQDFMDFYAGLNR